MALPSPTIIVGIDDATKCPVIGSIFVSAVAAPPATIRRWKRLGVKDSKLLTRKRRDALAPVIMAESPAFEIREITPAQIDDKSRNLNDWEMLTILQMMDALKLDGPIAKCIVDNWEVSAALFELRRKTCLAATRQSKGIPNFCFRPDIDNVVFTPEHRADENHVIVGAASILSKVHSDRQYDDYRALYGNFGSGSPGDPLTRLFLWTHRHNPPPIVRRSWNTFKHVSGLKRIEDDALYAKRKIAPARLAAASDFISR